MYKFSLAESLAKGPVVLYFFPAAFSVGCSAEAHEFAEAIDKFQALGATVIGVSGDDIDTLGKFSVQACQGKFPVASDSTQGIMKSYDAVMTLRPEYANRVSYVIAPNGSVVYNYQSLNPSRHVERTLAALRDWSHGETEVAVKGNRMRTVPSIVAAGLLAALVGAALAQTQSREDVRAEAASAAKAGQIDHGEVTSVPPARSTKSRPDVKSETRAAVKAGQIDHGEVTTAPPHPKASKTRAEVKAEAASAIKGGTLAHTDDGAPKAPAAARGQIERSKADDAGCRSREVGTRCRGGLRA